MSVKACAFLPVMALALVAWSIGGTSAPAQEAANPASRPGVVFIVGGVGGYDLLGPNAQWVLPRVGVPYEIEHFIWTHGIGQALRDLQDTPYLLQKAEELAAKVRRVKEQDPTRPVYLVGKSGGTALVLAAAEALPPQTLERVILLNAAVSPMHDLRPALRATKKEIVSFHSTNDRVILGWGTSNFGTADRYYGSSAGKDGFVMPRDLSAEDQALYQRLVQIPWNPWMMLDGYFGGHQGTSLPLFVANDLAPWLKP